MYILHQMSVKERDANSEFESSVHCSFLLSTFFRIEILAHFICLFFQSNSFSFIIPTPKLSVPLPKFQYIAYWIQISNTQLQFVAEFFC